MKRLRGLNRAVSSLIIVIISVVSSLLINPVTASALSLDEYFRIDYDTPIFSLSTINGAQVFYVTINGRATCLKDLPVSPSEVSITSRVIARNAITDVILNSSYIVTISPVPNNAGDFVDITKTVSSIPVSSELRNLRCLRRAY